MLTTTGRMWGSIALTYGSSHECQVASDIEWDVKITIQELKKELEECLVEIRIYVKDSKSFEFMDFQYVNRSRME